jgi:predicted nucleic acid-binding protein
MLADTSAWIWSRRRDYPELRTWYDEQLRSGEIATCDAVRLELLFGTRSAADHEQRRRELEALDTCPITPREWRRAIDVQGGLARLGADQQKVAKPTDLVIAAAAEAAGVELLHYDEDFEWIARVTGQPIRWLAAKGSLG